MGFLHKLWDETLAGPTPESGLGKLRKYDSFSATRSSSLSSNVVDHDPVMITRSITIVRSNSTPFRNLSIEAPDSPPAASSFPGTPLTPGTPPGDFKRFTRRKTFEQEAVHEPRSPTVYDWFSSVYNLI